MKLPEEDPPSRLAPAAFAAATKGAWAPPLPAAECDDAAFATTTATTGTTTSTSADNAAHATGTAASAADGPIATESTDTPNGAGEEKVPERESTSHLTSVLATPSSAAAATLREDADDAAPANQASAATTDAAVDNANADETTTSGGGDTHVVGFEGARDQIIVVAKKSTLWWVLLSEDTILALDRVYATFMLTPIFAAGGILSTIGLVIALVHDIEDKRWYWLFVGCGVWLPLVSLPHTTTQSAHALIYTRSLTI